MEERFVINIAAAIAQSLHVFFDPHRPVENKLDNIMSEHSYAVLYVCTKRRIFLARNAIARKYELRQH